MRSGRIAFARAALVARTALAVLAAVAPADAAAAVLRVSDVPGLQRALADVPEGGTIELAAGRYVTPPGALRIEHPRRSFTVRAAPGAPVTFDGEGHPILRVTSSNAASRGRVRFVDVDFVDGAAPADRNGGAITLAGADVAFLRCSFRGHRGTARNGSAGAIHASAGARVTLVASELVDNGAVTFGGGLALYESTAAVHTTRFVDNRTTLPGFSGNAAGGAIYALDSSLTVYDSWFEENLAGWTGGAIYAFGRWRDARSLPVGDVLVVGSTFVRNRAGSAAGGVSGSSFGGAVHLENGVTGRLESSVFLDNVADRGGAVDVHRAQLEIGDTVFRRNLAPDGQGGTIAVSSVDDPGDPQERNGLNRPVGRLQLRDSLIQGAGANQPAAMGGCLTAGGDVNRRYGRNGMPRSGSAAEHRAQVVVERSAFVDCVAASASGALGGAIAASLADLHLVDSIVLRSRADGSGAGGAGGALAATFESAALVWGSVLSDNVADRGGALFASGSRLDVAHTTFLRNRATIPRGSSLYTTPRASAGELPGGAPAEGVVTASLFADGAELPVLEFLVGGAPSRMRYNGNRFAPANGATAFVGGNAAPNGGLTVAQVNAWTLAGFDKSVAANTTLGAVPALGLLRVVPSLVPRRALPEVGPYAVFAGAGALRLDEAPTGASGLVPVDPGGHLLRAGGVAVSYDTVSRSCASASTHCLFNGLLRVDARWHAAGAGSGIADAVAARRSAGAFVLRPSGGAELRVRATRPQARRGTLVATPAAGLELGYTLRALHPASAGWREWHRAPR